MERSRLQSGMSAKVWGKLSQGHLKELSLGLEEVRVGPYWVYITAPKALLKAPGRGGMFTGGLSQSPDSPELWVFL